MPADRDADTIAEYLDGQLAPEEAVAFRDRVVSDPIFARALYLAAVDEAFLRAQARGDGESRPKAATAGWRSRFRRTYRVVGLAVLAASLLFVCWSIWPSSTPREQVARVERMTACQWADGTIPRGSVALGQAFQLRSGVAEFVTQTGVRTVFEGPSAFQFEGADTVRLTSGRLFCDVPRGAEGFTVQTANGRVVDLGTRFGVEIGPAGETEVHVIQGRVRTEISDSSARSELAVGQAGQFRSGSAALAMVPFQGAKFTTASGLIYEPFDYQPRLPLVGQGQWFDRDASMPSPGFETLRVLRYPELPAPRGMALNLNPSGGKATRPVGRPWPATFTSALIWIDDDFIKGMRMNRIGTVGLIGFGQSDPAKPAVRLIVKPGKGNNELYLGLRVGDQISWSTSPQKYEETQFVVLETSGTTARLWVNPSPTSFEAETPPTADVETALSVPPTIETLWLGESGAPKFAWWQIDEIRGGFRWADVTPRAVAR